MTDMRISDQNHRTIETKCLGCGATIDAGTQIVREGDEDVAPSEGDVTICLHCGHVMIYADDHGRLRNPTDDELAELAADEAIVKFNNFRGPVLNAFEAEQKRLKALPEPPPRIANLKKDRRGYPVPWFVHWRRGEGDAGTEPDFRVIRKNGRERALGGPLCWICGGKLGVHRVFVIGPMCVVNRVTMEPPSHRECAEYAAIACPFLAKPRMRRLPTDDLKDPHVAGLMIERNPGVTCLYETRDYRPFKTGDGKDDWLIRLGKPQRIDFWREGGRASREAVVQSIESGLPALMALASEEGPQAVLELGRMTGEALKLLPAS